MRIFIITAAAVVLLFACISPVSAYAEEDVYAEVTDEIDGALDEFGLGITLDEVPGLTFGELASAVAEGTRDRLAAPLRTLALVFLVVVAASILRNTAGNSLASTSAGTYDMVCTTAAAAAVAPQIIAVFEDTLAHIRLCGGFMIVFVPVFTAAAAMCGSLTTSGVYNVLILGASELITQLAESYLLPVLGAATALSVTGSVFPDTSLESAAALLKKVSIWCISVIMTLFTGFVSVKCTIAARTDGVAVKAAKTVISGMVPVVGGAVSDAYATVKGSFEVIGTTAGAAGIIGIVLLILPHILELFAYRGVMLAGAAAADMFSVPTVGKLLRSLDSALAIAQCVLVCYSLMFLISSAILAHSITSAAV